MAYKLQIVDDDLGVSFNGRYENLARAKRPSVVAKTPSGTEVKQITVYQGKQLPAGSTSKKWMDADQKEYSKHELEFWLGDQQVEEIEQTKVFNVEGYQEIKNYTDNYVISAFYELFPDDNGMKKDIDKDRAIAGNLVQMKKLFDHLMSTGQVARGEFCPASRGFIASDGYIRPIQMDGKWGLEIGVFKEEKKFLHLNDPDVKQPIAPAKKSGSRLKMV